MPAYQRTSTSWWRRNATVPNAITVVRIALIIVFVALLVRHEDGWAIAALAVAGVSDFLDGYLARRLGQTSALGRVLDPAADRLLTLAVIIGLAWRDIIPWWLVVVLVARDVVVGIVLLRLTTRKLPTPVVTFLGKTATAVLYVFLPLAYLTFDRSDPIHAVALVGATVGAVLYWGSGVQYLAQARRIGSGHSRTP